MDPATITALIAVAVEGIKFFSASQRARWSREGWHGLTFDEKQAVAKASLDVAFDNACKLKETPKNIFWQIMLPSIYRENEKNWSTFLDLNPWIVTDPNFTWDTEQRTGLKFDEVPSPDKCPKTIEKVAKSILSNKYFPYAAGAIVLLLIIGMFIRKK